MNDFRRDDHSINVHEYLQGHCGTSGCAVGYGPAAGLPLSPHDRNWYHYAERVFGLRDNADIGWPYLFSASWSNRDNTPAGTAKRIRYFLKNGVPKDDTNPEVYQ